MDIKSVITCTTLITLLAIVGVADFMTGYDFSLTLFYLVPVVSAGWYLGVRAGVFFSLLAAIVWMLVDQAAGHVYRHEAFLFWNGSSRLVLGAVGSVAASGLRRTLEKQKAAIFELRRTLLNLTELRGHVPVCPICQTFRDDLAFQAEVHKYVSEQEEPASLGRPCLACRAERCRKFDA